MNDFNLSSITDLFHSDWWSIEIIHWLDEIATPRLYLPGQWILLWLEQKADFIILTNKRLFPFFLDHLWACWVASFDPTQKLYSVKVFFLVHLKGSGFLTTPMNMVPFPLSSRTKFLYTPPSLFQFLSNIFYWHYSIYFRKQHKNKHSNFVFIFANPSSYFRRWRWFDGSDFFPTSTARP
jgi:hypothetical protein